MEKQRKVAMKLRAEVIPFKWNGRISDLSDWMDSVNTPIVPISNYFNISEDKLCFHGRDNDTVIIVEEGEYIVKEASYYYILTEKEYNELFFEI